MLPFRRLEQLLGLLLGILNSTDIEESLLRQIVDLAVENSIEALDGLFDGHHDTRQTCELRCHRERLRKETLYTTCTVHRLLIPIRKLIHTKDSNNILKLLIALQYLLHALGTVVVSLTHNQRIKDT